jgi:hypothetical protein
MSAIFEILDAESKSEKLLLSVTILGAFVGAYFFFVAPN